MHHQIQIAVLHHAVWISIDNFKTFDLRFDFAFTLALSLSGRYLFCGSDDNSVHTWDTLKTTYTGKYVDCSYFWCDLFNKMFLIDLLGSLNGHENRVTSVTIAPSGFALVSCSWDQYVRVWGWMDFRCLLLSYHYRPYSTCHIFNQISILVYKCIYDVTGLNQLNKFLLSLSAFF